MKYLNTACKVAFELTFVLFFALVIFAPLHARATKHFTIVQSFDGAHAAITGDITGLPVGSTVTLYRFNHDWKVPIGSATVEAVTPTAARIRVDPTQMSWPLGRHGIVSVETDGTAYVSLGADQGIAVEQYVNLYRDRANIGQAQIQRVEKSRSAITLPQGIGSGSGLTASEFTYATQATYFSSSFLTIIETSVIVLLPLAYALFYVRTKRSPFEIIGRYVRRIPVNRTLIFWGVNILAGIPFVWFMAKMPLYLIGYITSYISVHYFAHYIYVYPTLDTLLPYAYALLAIVYYVYLGKYQRSPILQFWKRISYPATSLSAGKGPVGKVSFARGLFLWALHLVIVYAFGSTLLGFLTGDINAARSIGFPAPTMEAVFEQAKFIIWALTVVGVLIGYGYSVVSILWGKFIRNLDFTVVGWLTNGFCYPFLGIVIWQMIPSFTGVDPIITGGPLQLLMLWLGLILNLLYMISIFNLGILFDLMADKGVRGSGFYSVIRHPNYMLEVCMFFVTELVGLAAGVQWLAILMYFFLYWIRSEREDNFMQYSNPEYGEYQKATPYKFLPGIY